MAIELAEAVAEKSQLKLITEGRGTKLERLYEVSLKKANSRDKLDTARSQVNQVKNYIKELDKEEEKLLAELNSGQITLSTTIEQAAPEDSEDDLGDIDLDNLEEDEAEAEALEPTEAEVESLQEGTGFYPEDKAIEDPEDSTEIRVFAEPALTPHVQPEPTQAELEDEEEASEGVEPEPATEEVD